MKIEQQELSPSPTTPGFIFTMAPHNSTTTTTSAAVSNSILLGFEEMFQQSILDQSAAASTRVSGQGSDTFPINKRARVEILAPNVSTGGQDEQQYDWQCDFNHTIASLNAKYGAIDKDCSLTSNWMTKLNLFGIYALLKQLEKKKLDEVDISSLSSYYVIVRDAENLNFNVNWLRERLDGIRVAVIARHEAKRLEASKNQHIKERKEKEEKLRWFQLQVRKLEDEVTAEDMEIENLIEEINSATAKFERFETHALLDGLM